MSYTLRDLPLPVKVVASVFLMVVGVGYTSAMLQLHMQDSKSGKPMPTVDDVIRKYTGKVKYDPNNAQPRPVGTFERLVSAPRNASWGGGGTMSPAFFEKDDGEWKKTTPADLPRVQSEREGEQQAAILWAQTEPGAREKAYFDDNFVPTEKAPKAITPRFKNDDGSIKIKSIIHARCARCHQPEGSVDQYPLHDFSEIKKYLIDPTAANGPINGYIKVEEPIGITKLTQTTHTHLLSFAVLFSLTGVIFAFSSYPTGLRCVLGPIVVLAVFADVSLWWAARLCDEWGPFFAMGIIGTGMVAGAGLFGQIVLSLFNMYGIKGKLVIGALLILGGVIASLIWLNKIDPGLKEKADQLKLVKNEQNSPKDGNGKNTNAKNDNGNVGKNPEPYRPINVLDRLLTLPRLNSKGEPVAADQLQFDGDPEAGSMAPAFFEKDKSKVYEKTMASAPQAEKDQLKAQRQAELDSLVTWVRSADTARKAAYESDSLEVPPALTGQVTADFVKDGKVKIKSIIDARCAACHAPKKPQKDYPLTNYEEFAEYLKPLAAAEPPAPAPAPAPEKAVEPIPDAKED